MLSLHDAQTDPAADVVSSRLERPLRVDAAAGGELDLGVQVSATAIDRELPTSGRVGLLGLRRLGHRYASDAQNVAERTRRERLVDLRVDVVEAVA